MVHFILTSKYWNIHYIHIKHIYDYVSQKNKILFCIWCVIKKYNLHCQCREIKLIQSPIWELVNEMENKYVPKKAWKLWFIITVKRIMNEHLPAYKAVN